MTILTYQEGDLLFAEGDPIDGVLRVTRGAVEVMRDHGAAAIVLGTVRAGEFLGEMGVLEHRSCRSATARATTDVEAERLSPGAFLDEVSRSPECARDLLTRMSLRLREAEDRIVADEQPNSIMTGGDQVLRRSSKITPITLAAGSPGLRRQIPEDIEVGHVPYLVGRSPLPNEPPGALRVDLALPGHEPLRLSRDHFAIVSRTGQLHIRDLRSTLGTTVNGRPIGEHFASDEAPLRAGDNEIIAGGVASPFVFTIRIGPQAK